MYNNVVQKLGFSTLIAFRYGSPSRLLNSCKLCGVGHIGNGGSHFSLQQRRTFSLSSPRTLRGKNQSFRYRRRGGSVVLLDTFIKQTNVDGTLVAKAPFNLSCSGSYFKENLQPNIERNRTAGESRDQFYKDEKIRRREESGLKLESRLEHEEEPIHHIPDHGPQIYMQVEESTSERDLREVESKILEQLSGQNTQNIVDSINHRTRSPLFFKLYGKSSLRVDSYSIMRDRAHSSHIYISDVGTAEEAVTLIQENGDNSEGKFSPSGSVSIWRPKQVSEVEITETGWDASNPGQEVVSALKIYSPAHITDDTESGLKGLFLCPVLMNKIYLEGEKYAAIDLNCKLMDQLVSVGLCTEYGPIKIRDCWSHDITLASRFGDIICEGTIEGNMTAEIFGDGDFVSRITVGNRLKVTTDSGDISLWSDCFAELAELYTITGHIHLRYLYGAAKILVKEHGSVSVNVVEGTIAAVVKSGSMFVNVEKLVEDSFLEVETGDITLTVPSDYPFRISLMATSSDIASEILNAGEFFLAGNGDESFVSGQVTGPGEFQPTISIKCHHGRASLQIQKDATSGRKVRGYSEF